MIIRTRYPGAHRPKVRVATGDTGQTKRRPEWAVVGGLSSAPSQAHLE